MLPPPAAEPGPLLAAAALRTTRAAAALHTEPAPLPRDSRFRALVRSMLYVIARSNIYVRLRDGRCSCEQFEGLSRDST